jgi:DNA repair exonuclease SbcCD ATPase subunit
MRLKFNSVTIKNFLSFGNSPTTFEYTSGINIVTGAVKGSTTRNGAGKSSLLVDSISFALYGKTLRGSHINKDELVNKVNKKDCEVSVDFSIGSNCYTVKRTIKPTTLIVIENGVEVKFDSMKHTQSWLEDKIGISHTCFSNILVLNINSSQPFLAMDSSQKRQIIEDILNLKVYSKMSEIAKESHLSSKGDVRIHEQELKSSFNIYNLSLENKKNIQELSSNFEKEKKEKIECIENEIQIINRNISKIKLNDDKTEDILEHKSKLKDIKEILSKSKTKMSLLQKDSKNYQEALEQLENTPHCPTCHTPTDNPIVKTYIEETRNKLTHAQSDLEKINTIIEKAIKKQKVLESKITQLEEQQREKEDNERELKYLHKQLESKQELLVEEQQRKLNIEIATTEEEVEKYKNKLEEAEKLFNKSSKDFVYSGFVRKILGEDGVRKFVLSKVIPYVNTKINSYLKILGSDFVLKFDNNLNEVINTRNGEERYYHSFSSGEKRRIDIAILLSLMDMAKLQNSVDTNILILDEVLDSSMDNEGIENFLMYLKQGFNELYPDKCVYIITHRNTISDDFYDRMIQLVKKNGFTYIDNIVEMSA